MHPFNERTDAFREEGVGGGGAVLHLTDFLIKTLPRVKWRVHNSWPLEKSPSRILSQKIPN